MPDPSLTIEQLLAHAGWLQDLARRTVGAHGADDLVQEVWLRAAQKPPSRLDSPRGWLRTVLRNIRATRVEQNHASRQRERESARGEALPSTADLVSRAEVQKWLVEAVLELEEPYREVLLLHYFEGLPAAEIARRSGENASTVRGRMARGIERLRDRLDACRGGREAWLGGVALLAVPVRSTLTGAAVVSGGWIMWKSVVACLVLALGLGLYLGTRTDSASERVPAAATAETASGDSSGSPAAEIAELSSADNLRTDLVPKSSQQAPVADPQNKLLVANGTSSRGVKGRVLDPDGEPIAGAVVYEGTAAEVFEALRRQETETLLKAETNADGRYTLEFAPLDVPESSTLLLSAHHESHAPSAVLRVELEEGMRTAGDLTLRAGAVLIGTVFGLDDNPIKGRVVYVTNADLGTFREATTDEKGRFVLNDLPAGSWQASTFPSRAERDAFVGSKVGTLQDQAAFTLEEGGTTEIELGRAAVDSPRVTGVLLHNGEAVSGLMSWSPVGFPTEVQLVQSGRDGAFTVDLPRSGLWTVLCTVTGLSARGQRRSFEFAPAEERDVIIDLTGAVVYGFVVNEEAEPLNGVPVELRVVSGVPALPIPTLGGDASRTDENGRFQFDLVQPGTYRTIVHGSEPDAEGTTFAAQAGHPFSVTDGSELQVADIRLEPGSRVVVRISDHDGRAVQRASLWFHDVNGLPLNPVTWTRSDKEGVATSPGLPLGTVWVSSNLGGLASPAVPVEVGVEDEISLTLSPARWIEIGMEPAVGRLGACHVSVTDSSSCERADLADLRRVFEKKPERSDRSARLVGPLAPGLYSIRVTTGEGEAWEDEIRLSSDSLEVTPLWISAKLGSGED